MKKTQLRKRLLQISLIIILFLFAASEGFIFYGLKPKLMTFDMPEWVDSSRACGALKDTFLISKDSDDSIHAWYLRADSATDKVAVIVHGYTMNALFMGNFAEMYDREMHYNILLPDLHYHGQSKGDFVQMGWRDRLDVLQWCAFADSLFGGNTRQVLHGVSMGSATIMSVSGEDLPPYIRCFIEDCGYTSVWDEFVNELDNQFSLPPFPLLYTTSWLTRLQNGWSFKEAAPLSQVAKCDRPMLFIHGGNDDFVKTEMVFHLYNAKKAPKQLCVFHKSKHALSYEDHKEYYTNLTRHFVNKYNK